MWELIKTLAGPLATIIASGAAVWITAHFARQNVAISKEQLRQARFDRRLEVYLSATAFFAELIRWENTEEQRAARSRFFVALGAAHFLFDGDVTIGKILNELNDSSFAIIGYKEHGHNYAADPPFAIEQFNKTQDHLLKHFPAKLEALRNAMRPYMDMSMLADRNRK